MAEQSVRQQARRAAYDTKVRLRAERAAQERALEVCAETVLVELATRDATIGRCEAAAGRALEQMISDHGLSVAAAGAWAGGLPAREVNRLRQAARVTLPDADADAAGPRPPDPVVSRADR